MTKREHDVITPGVLAAHARELAMTFGIHVRIDATLAPDDAGAGTLRSALPKAERRRCVKYKPITDETSYAVAMHELGHCLAPDGMLDYEHRLFRMTLADARLQVHEEEAAWAWAQYYALQWTPLMNAVKEQALDTYRQLLRHFELGHRLRRKGLNKR